MRTTKIRQSMKFLEREDKVLELIQLDNALHIYDNLVGDVPQSNFGNQVPRYNVQSEISLVTRYTESQTAGEVMTYRCLLE
ncbi:hypothetical protein M413DRAFT_344607 [Hebeloma cylindrosporum]|uniref:Uncharacterized protein n=1 Tax=Hebeloma cylindrosporum TaxID=76867 RepID=A0A0C3CPD1_HEBCY|nr:hypothetical protein M413DRAFT_344607 [Hebeloma cylindrosporum h7]